MPTEPERNVYGDDPGVMRRRGAVAIAIGTVCLLGVVLYQSFEMNGVAVKKFVARPLLLAPPPYHPTAVVKRYWPPPPPFPLEAQFREVSKVLIMWKIHGTTLCPEERALIKTATLMGEEYGKALKVPAPTFTWPGCKVASGMALNKDPHVMAFATFAAPLDQKLTVKVVYHSDELLKALAKKQKIEIISVRPVLGRLPADTSTNDLP